jgi:hypothetical protein
MNQNQTKKDLAKGASMDLRDQERLEKEPVCPLGAFRHSKSPLRLQLLESNVDRLTSSETRVKKPTRCAMRCVLFSILVTRFPLIVH